MEGTATLPDGTAGAAAVDSARGTSAGRTSTATARRCRCRAAPRCGCASPTTTRRPTRTTASAPPRRVQWGPLSTDEMGALWLEVVPQRADDAAILDARLPGARAARPTSRRRSSRRAARPTDATVHQPRWPRSYLQAGRVRTRRWRSFDARAAARAATTPRRTATSAPRCRRRASWPAAMRELQAAARLKPDDDRRALQPRERATTPAGRVDEAVRELTRADRAQRRQRRRPLQPGDDPRPARTRWTRRSRTCGA